MTFLQPQERPPWWRDERVLKIVLQAAFAVAAFVVLSILFDNLLRGMSRAGLSLGFRFLRNSANFGITEGIAPQPSIWLVPTVGVSIGVGLLVQWILCLGQPQQAVPSWATGLATWARSCNLKSPLPTLLGLTALVVTAGLFWWLAPISPIAFAPYSPANNYQTAFLVGVVNTIWLSSISIVLATVMGLLLGVARLSTNWLARNLATIVTEIFRNIPVLLIVIFWYQGVMLTLPGVRDSISFFDIIFVSQRGVNLPSVVPSLWLLPTVAILGVASWGIPKLLQQRRPDLGDIAQILWVGMGLVLLAIGCWILMPSPPLIFDLPVLDRFNFRGGTQFSAEFTALMLGLVTYTGCYIAEVVRGAFLSVARGQWEASRALGLSEMNTFRLVVVPQALRIMIPSLNTQYLTLIKNSSLAIAVGFSDLFNISSTIINQSGRSVEMFAIIMTAYLSMNLLVSYGMNWLNGRVKLVER
jgi:general L-amino acid transport system permease protein